jgi:hypothetical protein
MKKILSMCLLMITSLSFAQTDSTKVDNLQKTDEIISVVIKKALTVAEKTGEFAIEQAPILLQEFYNWHICANIFYIVLGLVLIIFGIWLSLKVKKYKDVNYIIDEPGPFFALFIPALIGLLVALPSIYDLIFILTAPKLYLIEYFIK